MSTVNSKKVLCFGEILIRLQATNPTFFQLESRIKNYFGGSETNVAATLAKLQTSSKIVTALPDNTITKEIITKLQQLNIDTSAIAVQGDRIGTYYLLSANGLSKGDVIYDRKYSSFYQLKIDDLNWDEIMHDCDWFHFSAITPALNTNLAYILNHALEKAVEKGLKISVDLNYRNRLWKYGKNPMDVMPELVKYADVIMGNIWAANIMLGTPIDNNLNEETSKQEYVTYANEVARQLFENFPKCQYIANTFRFMNSPKHNLFYGTLHTSTGNYSSETYETNDVVDRIGSGDTFMGGLIHAIKNNLNEQEIIDLATKAGYDKLFVEGDFIY